MHSYWRLLLLWILIVYPSEIRKRLLYKGGTREPRRRYARLIISRC